MKNKPVKLTKKQRNKYELAWANFILASQAGTTKKKLIQPSERIMAEQRKVAVKVIRKNMSKK